VALSVATPQPVGAYDAAAPVGYDIATPVGYDIAAPAGGRDPVASGSSGRAPQAVGAQAAVAAAGGVAPAVPPAVPQPWSIPAAPPTWASTPVAVPPGNERAARAHVVLWAGLVILALFDARDWITGSAYGAWPRAVGARLWWSVGASSRIDLALILLCGVGVFAGATALLPAAAGRRVAAIAMVAATAVAWWLVAVYVGRNPVRQFVPLLASGVFLAAWLVLRARKASSYALVPLAIATTELFYFVAGCLSFLPAVVSVVLIDLAPMLVAAIFGAAAARWMATVPQPGSPTGTNHPLPDAGRPPGTGYPAQVSTAVAGPPRQNTLAVVAFVMAFFCWLPALVCGHVALAQIRRTGERGRGLALAAVVMSYAWAGVMLLILVLFEAAVRASGW
jgi:hypothetical protein